MNDLDKQISKSAIEILYFADIYQNEIFFI